MHFFKEGVYSFHQILKGAMTQKRLRTSVLEGHKLTCFAAIRELNVQNMDVPFILQMYV
jgi:hypothetical protein